MAAASEQNDTLSVQNSAEIVFVDEDDFPLANLMEHVQSDDDLDDDFELVQDEEEADTPNRTPPVPRGRRNENTEWSENINLRPDLDFNQPTGARIGLEEDMKPVDFFQLYFTDALWNHIVDQTNLYAEQKRGPEERSVWYALTVNEFKAWIALTLNMGIVKKPSLRLYWSTDEIFKTPFFSAVMSRDRYFQIMRYLHFVDNQEEVKDKNSPNYDKLFKVRKLLDLLLLRFLEVYNPERNLSIDETLIKFKGKIYFRQFIPIKPGRFGIKCFTLAEASSGYGLVSKIKK